MRKITSFLMLVLVMLVALTTSVSASVNSDLAAKLYKIGAGYGINNYKVQIDRYLAENELTEEQANTIEAQAEEAVALMKEEGVTDYTKLSKAKKAELKNIATVAADAIDASIVVNSDGSVSLVDNETGKVIDTIKADKKAAYTGSNTNIVLVVSSVAVVALVAFAARKKFANA